MPEDETPLQIFIIRWGAIVVAILLTIYGGTGIHEYLNKAKEVNAAIAAFEVVDSPLTLVFQFLLFPVLSIIYALYIFVIAFLFMQVDRWHTSAMEYGAWVGVVLFTLMKVTDMYFWLRRASGASFGYYAMGLAGDIFMTLLWIAPFIALAEYFKTLFNNDR